MTTTTSTARHARVDSALGELTLVADGDALTGVYFERHWYPPEENAIGPLVDAAADPLFAEAAAQLTDYLAGERTAFTVPVATHGDPFQERVWALLRDIPYGTTTTYGDLAEQLGGRSLAQVVGRAVGRNPLSIVIACHRVVGKDGGLTGYAGGLERKRRLLDLEQPSPAEAGRLF
ncbi:cysteine methyltransferase [Prauserella marina]|uniref:Methylated-DNA--protein-cysteine methyltransferase n=1 Tax=Prauserella marina TaxID=530584 RepID=A0A222VKX3_9PSEU|nr:methylated-DNA--[protein]-cysteine S-methyltransferase [Prauserella marina]ASR34534.1 cysteine methyltransferase [Prauserella marina]PWV85858.1 methylated-DNA-[protein]-cysteine S-methyltransferase [Prauserella marina]SDC43762.1 methylated-DNA-[protein]-cysteine S-methyltransferase [Prauserella marina]